MLAVGAGLLIATAIAPQVLEYGKRREPPAVVPASAPRAAAPANTASGGWHYDSTFDELEREKRRYASLLALDGAGAALFVLERGWRVGMLLTAPGIIEQDYGLGLVPFRYRIDDGPITEGTAEPAKTGKSMTFVVGPDLAVLQRARELVIQVPMVAEGNRQVRFQPAGLDLARLTAQ